MNSKIYWQYSMVQCPNVRSEMSSSAIENFYGHADSVSEQGLTSPPTQYRLYGRRFFTGRKTQPTVSKYWRNTEYTINRKKTI